MKKMTLLLCALIITACANAQDLSTASYVDIDQYIGKWYAIKSLPQFFTRKCRAQTAEYKIIDSTTISVLNTCLKKKGYKTITGKAVVINPKTNAELVVTFNNFFTRLFRVKGDYTIIRLDDRYNYVLIGSKDRKSLWIMSRKPFMPEGILNSYVKTAKDEGFPVSRLVDSRF